MCFLIALVISVVVCLIIAGGYKTHSKVSAGEYTKSKDGSGNGVEFTQRQDVHIKTYTTQRPKQHQ
jgi:hypothetical protein